ncbi:hypothetical protein H7K33_26495 [Mycobacterium paraense]|uniref:hypothetical protein n=1 Tax=Mycobacterium paraense TaxID=767916 RepID=UPI00114E6727|nr:hypothetical protein [Mycobacterium paraense]MCV7445794.1 hypothetical protein [Mycobacterium paraense]
MMNPQPPPAAQWTQPVQMQRPASGRVTTVGLIIVGVVATAALVVGIIALTRPTLNAAGKSPTSATPTPTFSPDQVASAKKNLCTVYQLASKSVNQDTNGGDIAIARISLTNGGAMLDAAAANPALGQNERGAAQDLAAAYQSAVAISSVFDKGSSVFQQSIDDINRLDGPMAAICR